MGVCGGYWGFLTGDLGDRVIHFVIDDTILPPRKIPWKFRVYMFIRRVSRMGGPLWGTWRTLRVSDWRFGGQSHPLCHWCHYFTPQKISWKFCVHIFIRSVSRRGVLYGGTWRTLRVPEQRLGGKGHPWCHEGCCFTLRKIPWKFHVDIFIRISSGMGV